MSNVKIRSLRWLAPLAVVGALGLAACGDEGTEAVRAAGVGPAAIGSDRHLENRSAEIAEQRAYRASSERLAGQAAAYAQSVGPANAAVLQGNAERYVEWLEDRAASTNTSAQLGNAERYVEWLEDRAASGSPDDEFVPGSRRMPM
jgi:hypothetical protein